MTYVVSGNRETEVAAFWLASKEDEETLERVVQLFKSHGPHWSKVKTILIDKDPSERAMFARQFQMLICNFVLSMYLRAFEGKQVLT